MRKREFLRKLNNRLGHLDRSERNDILDYYDELIEDSIDRTGKTEAEVIYDLGDLEDIVRRVDPSYKSRIRYEEEEEDYPNRRRNERQNVQRARRREPRRSSGGRSIVGIVLMICLFPLWIAAFIALFALIIGIVCAGVGVCVAGIVSIWQGFTIFAANSTSAIFQVGLGILCIGVTLIVAPLIIKIICLIGKLISQIFKCIFNIGNTKRRYAYEN